MSSPGQPEPKGTLGGAGPAPGVCNPKTPPAGTLGQLKDQLPRLQLQVTTQLESIYHLFSRVRQELQEHHKQVETFLQVVEACSPALDGQPAEVGQLSPGKRADEGAREALSPTARQPLEVRPLQVSDFEDVVTAKFSGWRRQPRSGQDETARPCQGAEPQLWQDVLTFQLWQAFADVHDKAAAPRCRVTKRVPGLDGKSADWRGAGPGAGTVDPSAPILAESPPSSPGDSEEEMAAAFPAQEPPGGARPLLRLVSWEPEDFGGSWRPDAPPLQSRRFAIPRKLQRVHVLRHGEPVLALAISSFTRHVFTCGKGGVKVWSLVGLAAEDSHPEAHLPAGKQAPGAYLRTCLLSPSNRTLLTGGHNLGSVSVWDLAAPSLHVKCELACPGLSCEALAADEEETLAFAGLSQGSVRIWDLRDQHVVRDLSAQQDGAKSIVVKDRTVWTGGLGARLHRWDLRMAQEPLVYPFQSQIMSLSHSPQEDWLLLGLANGQHWLQHDNSVQTRMAGCRDRAVLGLKFSPYGQWWVSVGMDSLVSIHSMPEGAPVLQLPEPSCVLCCDVSSDNRLVVAGAGDQASVYLAS